MYKLLFLLQILSPKPRFALNANFEQFLQWDALYLSILNKPKKAISLSKRQHVPNCNMYPM